MAFNRRPAIEDLELWGAPGVPLEAQHRGAIHAEQDESATAGLRKGARQSCRYSCRGVDRVTATRTIREHARAASGNRRSRAGNVDTLASLRSSER